MSLSKNKSTDLLSEGWGSSPHALTGAEGPEKESRRKLHGRTLLRGLGKPELGLVYASFGGRKGGVRRRIRVFHWSFVKKEKNEGNFLQGTEWAVLEGWLPASFFFSVLTRKKDREAHRRALFPGGRGDRRRHPTLFPKREGVRAVFVGFTLDGMIADWRESEASISQVVAERNGGI